VPSFEIGLSSPALAVALAVLAAYAAAFLSYRRTLPPVSTATRMVLTILRGTALSLLVLLLFEPVVRAVFVSSRHPLLAVLIDNSSSMRLRDASGRRDSVLWRTLGLLPGVLPEGTDLAVYSFGSSVSGPRPSMPESLRFDEPSTNIARALRVSGETPGGARAVLLLTDGNATAGPNPLYAAEDLRLPVYAIGIGDSAEQRDLMITAVSANRVMLAGVPTPAEIRVKSAGYGGERVGIAVSDGEREVARTELTLRSGVSEYGVPLTFTPRGEGTRLFTARLSVLPGELTADNNRRTFQATVLKARLSIVLLSGAPGPDEAIMRQTLQEDPNVLVRAFTQRPDGGFFEGEPPASALDSCDCLVMLGYPGTGAGDESVRRIAGAVIRRRIPVLFVAGRSLDHERAGAFSELLPFTAGDVRGTEQSIFVVPHPAHRDHPLLTPDSSIGVSSWAALPPLFRTSTTYFPKPGATVLATARLQSVQLPDPFLIVRSVGGSRAMAILGYGLWRWRLMAQGNPEISTFYASFLSTAVRWLTTRDDTRPVRIMPVRAVSTPLEPVEFEGRVADAAARPLDNAEVTVTLTGGEFSGGITLSAAGDGRYTGEFSPLPEGNYRYTGRASIGENVVGADSGRLVVGALDLEAFDTRMAAEPLRLLASRTGGRFFLPGELAAFGEALRTQTTFSPVEQRTASTVEFRHWPLLLVLVILLLAAEWFIRKRSGML